MCISYPNLWYKSPNEGHPPKFISAFFPILLPDKRLPKLEWGLKSKIGVRVVIRRLGGNEVKKNTWSDCLFSLLYCWVWLWGGGVGNRLWSGKSCHHPLFCVDHKDRLDLKGEGCGCWLESCQLGNDGSLLPAHFAELVLAFSHDEEASSRWNTPPSPLPPPSEKEPANPRMQINTCKFRLIYMFSFCKHTLVVWVFRQDVFIAT